LVFGELQVAQAIFSSFPLLSELASFIGFYIEFFPAFFPRSFPRFLSEFFIEVAQNFDCEFFIQLWLAIYRYRLTQPFF
jgi:hypothetical protein